MAGFLYIDGGTAMLPTVHAVASGGAGNVTDGGTDAAAVRDTERTSVAALTVLCYCADTVAAIAVV